MKRYSIIQNAKNLAITCALVAIPSFMHAGTVPAQLPPPPERELAFSKGQLELETLLGIFYSINSGDEFAEPDLNYGLVSVRLGKMLNDPSGDGIFRGNFELMVGLFGGGIYEGPGDYLAGAELGLRYNFIQPSATVVPFIQLGGGGVYSDAAGDDRVQRLIGSDWSFQLHGALGIRWMLSERCAFTTAVQYLHVSNAGTEERNQGLDSLGGLVGFSWFF